MWNFFGYRERNEQETRRPTYFVDQSSSRLRIMVWHKLSPCTFVQSADASEDGCMEGLNQAVAQYSALMESF